MTRLSSSVRFAIMSAVVFTVLSLTLYIGLETTAAHEQAQSLGQKDLGVAVLGIMIGIPILLLAGGAILSLIIAGVLWCRILSSPRN